MTCVDVVELAQVPPAICSSVHVDLPLTTKLTAHFLHGPVVEGWADPNESEGGESSAVVPTSAAATVRQSKTRDTSWTQERCEHRRRGEVPLTVC